ncbi:hypothetical protein H4S08_000112 [Coemansia sp. RSA 1365]|nr:hypothetical protein H4S08_000112 [Coemansia sp. RSA 1365]
MDSSDFESVPDVSTELNAAPKRKRSISGLQTEDSEPIVDSNSGEPSAVATDNDQSGAEDNLWDISKIRDSLPQSAIGASTSTRIARAPLFKLPPKMRKYTSSADEEIEHPDLEVLNESSLDEGEAETTDDLPCRTLDNFVVFDQDDNNTVVELDDLGMEGTDITIAGNVEPLKASDLDRIAGGDQEVAEDEDEDDECAGDGYNSESRATATVPNGKDLASNQESISDADSWTTAPPGDSACVSGSDTFVQRIRLSAILNYETYLTQNGETEVWVRTCFAWYKLLNPHPGYVAIYSSLYKSVYIAHQAIVRSKTNPGLTIAQFIRELRESPNDIISRLSPITDGDFRKYRESIVEEIEICLEATGDLELIKTSLIRAICGLGQKTVKKARSGAGRTSSLARGTRTTGRSVTVGEPKHENPSCITPLIASIAQGLYAQHLVNVSHFDTSQGAAKGTDKNTATSKDKVDLWKKKYTEATKTKRSAKDVKGIVSLADLQQNASVSCFQLGNIRCSDGSRLPQVETDRLHFDQVQIAPKSSTEGGIDREDVITIKIGEAVLVRAMQPEPGYDPSSLWEGLGDAQVDEGNAQHSTSSDALVRVVQVTSIMFSIHEERWMLHGRMLLPGRNTVLQEVAMPNEWFLVDSCRTYWIGDSLCGKANISFIPSTQTIDVDEWATKRQMYCQFWYDVTSGMFEDVNAHIQGISSRTPMWCRSCTRKKMSFDAKLGRTIVGVRSSHHNNTGVSSGSDLSAVAVDEAAKSHDVPEYLATATIGDTEYHVSDMVYILSEHSDQPFQIGYVLKFIGGASGNGRHGGIKRELRAEVQILRRMRILPPEKRPVGEENRYNDERHLFWTPLMQVFDVADFRGKCWVMHPDNIGDNLNAYKDTDSNAFYARYESTRAWPEGKADWIELKPARDTSDTSDKTAVDEEEEDERMPMQPCCLLCKRERQRRMDLMTQFLRSPDTRVGPLSAGKANESTSFARGSRYLRALDLFSGCGGLTQGLDQSGVVKTLWSVEYMPSAGMTFAKNHPDAQVYNQCSNLLLESAIKTYHGAPTQPLINKFDGKELPPMPRPGDVDFIYCGPPCQGFSRCNRFIKADDIKTSLIANALSYVDFYRPTYFLLENVRGLIDYRLGGVQIGPGRVSGGIKMGALKFILRALTTMGYQARFYVLQAGNFGLAQSRRRLFVWACKRGCRLPGVPSPISTFGKSGQVSIHFPDGTTYEPHAHLNGNAPHHSITVEDAIGDLPKFEFVNPALVYPGTDSEVRNPDWPQYIAVSGQPTNIPRDLNGRSGYVGHMEMQYSVSPTSEFQRRRRRQEQMCLPGIDSNYGGLIDTLYNHVCRKFNDINTERICRVVMEPGMDHRSLPDKLKPWCLSAKESAASRHNGWKGLYGRLRPEGYFGTALTEMQPMGKSGTVLLYDQRRVLSVRECARAQGFPDNFRLYSINADDTRDMHRQVGNAVPPPLAFALSLELREALFQDFVENKPEDEACHITDEVPDSVGDILGDFCIDLTGRPQTVVVDHAKIAIQQEPSPSAEVSEALDGPDCDSSESKLEAGLNSDLDGVVVMC